MMKTIAIPDSPLQLSALALGTGAFGTGVTEDVTERIYAAYREAGGNTLDTAHCYCAWLPGIEAGSSERAVGACVKKFKDRKNVFIATKGGHPASMPFYPRPDAFMSPERVTLDIEESLERLGMETIDLYFLHRDDPRMPVGEIVDALNRHLCAGRLNAIGVSNWTTARIAEANAYAKENGLQGFVVSQPQFSLAKTITPEPKEDPANRALYEADIAWHGETGLPVMCYSPTAGGYFATGGERGKKTYDNDVSRARMTRAQELAKKKGVSANQVALAWVMGQKFPAIPILGTGDVEHLRDCLRAADVTLSEDEVNWLRGG
jgi:aryl-alcohol dehydrogenase-like predicted oxidoreductase